MLCLLLYVVGHNFPTMVNRIRTYANFVIRFDTADLAFFPEHSEESHNGTAPLDCRNVTEYGSRIGRNGETNQKS